MEEAFTRYKTPLAEGWGVGSARGFTFARTQVIGPPLSKPITKYLKLTTPIKHISSSNGYADVTRQSNQIFKIPSSYDLTQLPNMRIPVNSNIPRVVAEGTEDIKEVPPTTAPPPNAKILPTTQQELTQPVVPGLQTTTIPIGRSQPSVTVFGQKYKNVGAFALPTPAPTQTPTPLMSTIAPAQIPGLTIDGTPLSSNMPDATAPSSVLQGGAANYQDEYEKKRSKVAEIEAKNAPKPPSDLKSVSYPKVETIEDEEIQKQAAVNAAKFAKKIEITMPTSGNDVALIAPKTNNMAVAKQVIDAAKAAGSKLYQVAASNRTANTLTSISDGLRYFLTGAVKAGASGTMAAIGGGGAALQILGSAIGTGAEITGEALLIMASAMDQIEPSLKMLTAMKTAEDEPRVTSQHKWELLKKMYDKMQPRDQERFRQMLKDTGILLNMESAPGWDPSAQLSLENVEYATKLLEANPAQSQIEAYQDAVEENQAAGASTSGSPTSPTKPVTMRDDKVLEWDDLSIKRKKFFQQVASSYKDGSKDIRSISDKVDYIVKEISGLTKSDARRLLDIAKEKVNLANSGVSPTDTKRKPKKISYLNPSAKK
jgi:hypothetical protein